jgi:DNA invertase Pin-like site-specific DNA recombinase
MLIGYARVSTIDQDLALQREALRQIGCERIFEETASGAKADRPQLLRALDHMRAGDTLVVWKLDHLAQSIQQLIDTVALLDDNSVQLRSLTEQIDTATPTGRLTFHIFSALAEIERSLIRERTMAGLAASRAAGRVGGRPRKLTGEDLRAAQMLFASGEFTLSHIAKHYGVGRTTLYRALKSTREAA